MKTKIKIAEIAVQHGFKNAYALQNALKCSPTMAARLWSGEFKQIGIETIEKLCELFQCSPNDLFGYDVAPGDTFNNSVLDIVQSSSDNEYILTTADVARRSDLNARTVREYAEKGLLKGKQGKQNHWFFRESDVVEFMARRD